MLPVSQSWICIKKYFNPSGLLYRRGISNITLEMTMSTCSTKQYILIQNQIEYFKFQIMYQNYDFGYHATLQYYGINSCLILYVSWFRATTTFNDAVGMECTQRRIPIWRPSLRHIRGLLQHAFDKLIHIYDFELHIQILL